MFRLCPLLYLWGLQQFVALVFDFLRLDSQWKYQSLQFCSRLDRAIFRKNAFSDPQQYYENHLRNIEAPISHFSEVVFDDRSVHFDVSGAFFSICAVEESESGKFCSGAANIMRSFTSQSVMDVIRVTVRKGTVADDTGHIIDAIGSFVQSSAMLPKRLKQKCNKALRSREELAKDLFFQLLRYTLLFAPKAENCRLGLESMKSQERKEAY